MSEAAVAAPVATTTDAGSPQSTQGNYSSGQQSQQFSVQPQLSQQFQQHQQSVQQSQPASWFSGIEDADLRGYIENKGWPNPVEAIKSYRNLERMNGMDKIAVPKDLNDHDAWDNVYNKLGRPEGPADYGIAPPEGEDGAFAGWASELFHKAGLNTTQARYIAEAFNEYQSQFTAQDDHQFQTTAHNDIQNIRREWGADFDRKMAAAQTTSQFLKEALGWDKNTLNTLERAIGTRELINLYNVVGERLVEDRFQDSGSGHGRFMSPEAAQSRIKELSNDPQFVQRYQDGETSARAEMDKLNRMLAGRI